MEYVREPTERPGVFRIRRAGPADWGLGTVEAGRIFEALCRVCFHPIGSEPFVEVNEEPKHFRHVQGE